MDMRPRYHGRVDANAEEMDRHYPPKQRHHHHHRRGRSPPSSRVRVREPQEIRDVVEDVRNELIFQRGLEETESFELPTKEELMEIDTVELWSTTTSLMDGALEDDNSTTELAAPLRDFSKKPPPPPILRNQQAPTPVRGNRARPASEEPSTATRTISDTVGTSTVDQSTVVSWGASTVDESTTDGTVQSTDYSSACFSGFGDLTEDAKELFCCNRVVEAADTSNAVVETAATELLHGSIIEQADSFFSDEQARSLRATLSEVSLELDAAGNNALDLTTTISTNRLCMKKDSVNDDVVQSKPGKTVPDEVSFKTKALTRLNSMSNKKSAKKNKKQKRRQSQTKQPQKEAKKKKGGLFSRFRKSKRAV